MITEANVQNILLHSGTVTAGGTGTGSFDTRGFDFAQINVFKSLSAALTTLKIESGDTTSAYSSINLTSGVDFTAATNGTATLSAEGTNPYYTFNIDLRGQKRYLKVTATPDASTALRITATLGRRQIGAPVAGTDAQNILSI